jgi:hypothetical protein
MQLNENLVALATDQCYIKGKPLLWRNQKTKTNKEKEIHKMPTTQTTLASGTTVNVKTETKVEANPKLKQFYSDRDQFFKKADNKFVAICELVRDQKITNAVIVATLQSLEYKDSTIRSEVSRIRKLVDNPELLTLLKEGKITVSAARAAKTPNSTGAGPKPAEKRSKEELYQGRGYEFALYGLENIPNLTVEEHLKTCAAQFSLANAAYQAAKAAEIAKAKGEFESSVSDQQTVTGDESETALAMSNV